MTVAAKDLRFNIFMLFDLLSKGEDITVTYRGKPTAKLIPADDDSHQEKTDIAFGMWQDQDKNVDEMVRDLRKGRTFDI
jgi:prevent-host-death family protein